MMKLEAIKILLAGPDMRLVSILPNDNMFYGYPYGGAMDYKSASAANKLLGKSAESKLIECSLKGCKLFFNQDMHICITGADMNWKLDDVELRRCEKLVVKKGQILSSGFARKGLRNGQVLVLTQDAQTTGGYPRIAYFDKENLCDFNQLGIGHKLKWRLLL